MKGRSEPIFEFTNLPGIRVQNIVIDVTVLKYKKVGDARNRFTGT